MSTNFEPRILSFLCNWCSYAGADFAGISRLQYPPNIIAVRTMCSGRVEPAFAISALLSGFDGVLVLGCHPGDCHYLTGNYHAEKKMEMSWRVLHIAGIDSERLRLDWVSAAEGKRFVEIVTSFINRVKSMGPLYSDDRDGSLHQRLEAVKATLQAERIRWLVGSEIGLLEKGNVFGEKLTPDDLGTILNTVAHEEYMTNWIATLLEEHPMSVGEIAQATGLESQVVSSYLVDLEQTGEVVLHGFDARTPKYVRR